MDRGTKTLGVDGTTWGDKPWGVRTKGDRVPGGYRMSQRGDGKLHMNQTSDADNNGETEKGTSPKYRPPTLGTPPCNEADGGVRGNRRGRILMSSRTKSYGRLTGYIT